MERNLNIELAQFQIQPEQVRIYSEGAGWRDENQWMENSEEVTSREGIFLAKLT